MRSFSSIKLGVLFIVIALFLGMGVSTVYGQYFGKNKVLYKNFDFKVMKTKHFDIYFYPEFQEAAEQAGRLAERWYIRYSRMLNHNLSTRQILILYSSSPHFQQTTVISEMIGEGTSGLTESLKWRIVLPLGISLAESDHVIGHELVHAFQYDMTSQGYASSVGAPTPGAAQLPLWRDI